MQGSNICEYDKCTGCFACANACPKRSISLTEDQYGEVHPQVDQDTCIDCNICQKTCPNNRDISFEYPEYCYAAWNTDKAERQICASGGMGTMLSESVIKQGGVVFGSRYDENLTPVISYTDKIEELEYFKGSRYVQSLVGNETFRKVKEFLQAGRLVLYIGTPCQIAGLYGFLKKSYDNLITVDLICHGVSPTKYFKEEIAYLTGKYNLRGIKDARFRGNDGNNYRMTLWDKDRKKIFPRDGFCQLISRTDYKEDTYLRGFLTGTSLRENCYTCRYSRPGRISDITIGDFIGLGKHTPFPYPTANVSSVTVNTDKGFAFLNDMAEKEKTLMLIDRDYQERLEYRPSLLEPFKRDARNKEFRKDYLQYGFPKAIRIVLADEINRRYKCYIKNRYNPKRLVHKLKSSLIKK